MFTAIDIRVLLNYISTMLVRNTTEMMMMCEIVIMIHMVVMLQMKKKTMIKMTISMTKTANERR